MNEKRSKADEFLRGYRIRVKAVRSAESDYQEASDIASSMTARYGSSGGGSGSPSGDAMANAACRMMDVADGISETLSGLSDEYREILGVIVRVGERNDICGDILRCVYMEGMPIQDVCQVLARGRVPYSRSSVYRLLDAALDMACEEMER